MNQASPNFRQERFIYIAAAFFSILISTWLNYRETVINPDAICYLISAEAVGRLGVKDAMHLCGQAIWPFYSILIYSLVQFSHLSYATTAYLIDTVFSAFSVAIFILIVKELGAQKRVLWFAAAVILLSHEFNSTREYIVRDHGFWAFYLASIFFLLRYFRKPTLLAAFFWQASLFMATLFRIEGAIFLALVPFSAFFLSHSTLRTRFANFFTLNGLSICLCVLIAGYLVLHPEQRLEKLGRVHEVTAQLQHGLSIIAERYTHSRAALAQYVLTTDSAKDAGLVLSVLLIGWYFVSVLTNLSWIYGFLFFYSLKKRAISLTNARACVLFAYLIINFFITFVFLWERMFLSKRYLIALSLVCMLFVPFALEKLMQTMRTTRERMVLVLIWGLIGASALGGIVDFGYSKSYIHEAGTWLAKNVPDEALLYANDYQLMYYSRHFGDEIFKKQRQFVHIDTIAQERWKQYDYIALRLNKNDDAALKAIAQHIKPTPDQVFGNKRGDQVAIYKVK